MPKTIVIQRGHCYRTSGVTGAPGEQEFATAVSVKIKPMLEKVGFTVSIINADVPNSYYDGDAFVAVHYDGGSASGGSVGYQNEEGDRLAQFWKKHYRLAGWTRGFLRDNYTANLGGYYGVSKAIAQGTYPAIITESGFHNNPGDAALMTPTRTAISITNALAEYFGKEIPVSDFGPEKWDADDRAAYRQIAIGESTLGQMLESTFKQATSAKTDAAAVRAEMADVKAKLNQIAAGNVDYNMLAVAVANELNKRLDS